MRGGAVRTRHEEEEESVFVSMTDMTVSFLFIVMILLAFFATQFSDEDLVPRSDLVAMRKERDTLQDEVERLRRQLEVAQSERDEAIEALDATRAERDMLQEERHRLSAEVIRLSTLLEAATRARDEAVATLDRVRAERDLLLEDRRRLSAEITRLSALLNAAMQARDEALEALLRMRAERDLLEEERDRALEREELARNRIANLEKKLAKRDRHIRELERKIENLEATLAKLKRRDPLEAYMARAAAARARILQELRNALLLDFPDLMIEISAESDALRFQGEGLFDKGRDNLARGKAQIVRAVADRLADILPCYTLGPRMDWREDCNPGLAIIEAVQIEGHTDKVGGDIYNLGLSTRRANTTFATMWTHRKELLDYLNIREQPVLSVAGYGRMRPVAFGDTAEDYAINRRIDLRIIMHTPAGSDEIERIREALDMREAEE
ncbi:hypothetical protein LNKW23_37760 [Paralimibaculum aggregatum]|uniref:OmpA-like domain-containing protein n=1 Tax=Paralimibaculum aggregatum TaxID=3036245 RepID=A0ABQ6LQ12_9RHOB|nr:OmpA family protein [Limibaculum sp. NKW23]GMG84560.1 hypothetical protein LNKW23_37760 [Limibaculum sp. NKW23]